MSFKPDYGLRLKNDGVSRDVDQIFFDFRLYSLTVLGCGQYSTGVEIPLVGELHALSLDFNQEQLEQILSKAPPQIAVYLRQEISRDPVTPRRIDFEGEVVFGVRARLGELQAAQRESFVPLVAQEILSGSNLTHVTETEEHSTTLSSGRRVATPTPHTPPAPSVLPQTTAKTLLKSIVGDLRSIPTTLYRDDSPLANAWEEIKEQVQQGLSLYWWPAYLLSIRGTIDGTVDELSATGLLAISYELRVPSGDKAKIVEVLLRRLLARARREKVRYAPFDFEYFRYSIAGMCVYAQIMERTGAFTCRVLAYSAAAPDGEQGEINTNTIQSILTADDFEKAKRLNWPDQWR